MITTTIGLCEKYDYLEDKFKKAYDFLKNTDLEALPEGRMEIDGDNLFANVMDYTSLPESDCRFEAHDKYFDIQFVVKGMEYFGYVNRDGLIEDTEYDETKDLIFYKNPAHYGQVLLTAGELAVVAPEDAHMPKCMVGSPCQVRKIVIKVRI